jgi:hypothetical protein
MVLEVDKAGFLEAREDLFGGRAFGGWVTVEELGEVYELKNASIRILAAEKKILTGINRSSLCTAAAIFCSRGSISTIISSYGGVSPFAHQSMRRLRLPRPDNGTLQARLMFIRAFSGDLATSQTRDETA